MEKSAGNSAPGQAKDKVQEVAGQAPGQAKDKVQEVAGQASEQARTRVTDVVSQRSTDAGNQVATAADALRQTSSQLREKGNNAPAKVMDTLAGRIDGVASWLRDSDGDEILHDIEDFGRRQPTAIIASSLALGFAASRLLRASSSRRYETRSGSGSLDRYRTTGRPRPRTTAPTTGTAALSGSPTSGLTAEGDTASAPTSRMGLDPDPRDADARRRAGVRPDSSPTGGV